MGFYEAPRTKVQPAFFQRDYSRIGDNVDREPLYWLFPSIIWRFC